MEEIKTVPSPCHREMWYDVNSVNLHLEIKMKMWYSVKPPLEIKKRCATV